MPSFDIANVVNLQEVDNAVNNTVKTLRNRYDFRDSKTEITLDKKDKIIHVVTEDEMKMRAIHQSLVENLARRKVDPKGLEAKEIEKTSQGMIKRDFAIQEGIDVEMARQIVKITKGLNLKVQAAIQDNQVRVSGKKIDDLQAVIRAVREAKLGIPLQFVNMKS